MAASGFVTQDQFKEYQNKMDKKFRLLSEVVIKVNKKTTQINKRVDNRKKDIEEMKKTQMIHNVDITELTSKVTKNSQRLHRTSLVQAIAKFKEMKNIFIKGAHEKYGLNPEHITGDIKTYSHFVARMHFIGSLYHHQFSDKLALKCGVQIMNWYVTIHNRGLIIIDKVQNVDHSPNQLLILFSLNPKIIDITFKNKHKFIIQGIYASCKFRYKYAGLSFSEFLETNKKLLVKADDINTYDNENDSGFFALGFNVNTGHKTISNAWDIINEYSEEIEDIRPKDNYDAKYKRDCIIVLDINLEKFDVGPQDKMKQFKINDVHGRPLDPQWFLSNNQKRQLMNPENEEVKEQNINSPSPPPPSQVSQSIFIPETINNENISSSASVNTNCNQHLGTFIHYFCI